MVDDPPINNPANNNVIRFPNSGPSHPRRINIEQFAGLKIYDVIPNDGTRGVYIDGFSSKAESDKFIHDLDDFFLGKIEPEPTKPSSPGKKK